MTNQTAAIVLAAGLSTRMGKQKLLLSWGESTIINTVVDKLQAAKITTIVVVTGKERDKIEKLLSREPVKIVYNPRYKENNMAISLQTGLNALSTNIATALITLGDQPQIESKVIKRIIDCYHHSKAKIIIPQFKGKKGHPWLLDRTLWDELLLPQYPPIMRDFQLLHKHQIELNGHLKIERLIF
jgi:molybdenum cofactor cytidylyltransferase